jgi:hypothetical protein
MKLSRGIKNFWLYGIQLLIANAIATTLLFIGFGGIAASISAGVGVFWVIRFLQRAKSQMLRKLSGGWNVEPVNLESISSVDLNLLQQQTAALEALGFVHLMDYERLEYSQVYVRCFAHPQQYCFAELGQVPESSGDSSLRHFAIFSLLDQGWRVVNRLLRKEDGLYLLVHNPKTIAIQDSNPNLEEFFQSHLRSRQQITTNLNISVLTDVSWDAYVQFNQNAVAYMKQTLKRNSLLVGIIKATLYELNPKPDWFFGDYPTLAAQQRPRNR